MKIQKLSSKHINFGGYYTGEHVFTTDAKTSVRVPLFHIETVHSLNQILGYAKFINSEYGTVYFRGENKLHSTLTSSIYRPIPENTRLCILEKNLNTTINKLIKNKKFSNFLKIQTDKEETKKIIIESMLQHYGFHTHCLDVVDNSWVALWFGLHKFQSLSEKYYSYQNRTNILKHQPPSYDKQEQFQYLILIAADHPTTNKEKGISIGKNIITIDLRKALPSLFLRPHAQHSLVLRHKKLGDFSENVVGILKLHIQTVNEWLGVGELLSYRTFFPSPAFDQGYDILLQTNPSCHVNKILKYI